MGAVWHSGSIRSSPTTLNWAHFHPGVVVEVSCSMYYINVTLVFYPSAPLMGGHSARQTSLLEAMFHKYRHIS